LYDDGFLGGNAHHRHGTGDATFFQKNKGEGDMLKDIINRNLLAIEPDAKVSDAAKLMASEDVGCVLILDNGKPRGMITDRDIVVRCLAKNIDVDDCTVENVMTESLETVKDTDGIFDCIEMMKGAGVRRVPVVDERGMAIGLVSFGDLLAVLSKELSELTSETTPASEFQQKIA
jgi:CBS domain-containing protein